jgi:aldehyde dehydrogenase family 7 protein A1
MLQSKLKAIASGIRIRRFSQQTAVEDVKQLLQRLGVNQRSAGVYSGKWHASSGSCNIQVDPSTGQTLGEVQFGSLQDYKQVTTEMTKVKRDWSETPAPIRGEVVRKIGEKLRQHKDDLGMLISLEMGKILTEGLGEVQEAIDICDYSVGLSRMLNGSVIPSERPGHMMMERWNPLMGHVGIISAFNFPVAVYFWNLAISLVAGNTNLWKPHEGVSLTAIAVTKLVAEVLEESKVPGAIASLICGTGNTIGQAMLDDKTMELISFTGSTRMGKHVAVQVAQRFGKSILELGGNNAMIVDKSANLNLALRATLFGAVGTAGQRCTTLRRLYLHRSIHDDFLLQLSKAYKSIKIGSPLDKETLCGPLFNRAAVETFEKTIIEAQSQGGIVKFGGKVLSDRPGNFVEPTIISISSAAEVVQDERFVPILYVMPFDSFDEAVTLNNSVTQGLSSALFTQDVGQIFQWSGPLGSDCGIVNVNIGTSGAEIGGAFGGEKATGGGRESGSDAWKQYMRRSTCTTNYSKNLPLAQGVNFGG